MSGENIIVELKKVSKKLNVLILQEIEGDCDKEFIDALNKADSHISKAIDKIKKADSINKAR